MLVSASFWINSVCVFGFVIDRRVHMDGERISASGVGVQKMEVSSVHIAAGQLQWIHVVC